MRPAMEFNPSMASILMALPRDRKRPTLTCKEIGQTVRLNNAHTTDWLIRLFQLGLVLKVVELFRLELASDTVNQCNGLLAIVIQAFLVVRRAIGFRVTEQFMDACLKYGPVIPVAEDFLQSRLPGLACLQSFQAKRVKVVSPFKHCLLLCWLQRSEPALEFTLHAFRVVLKLLTSTGTSRLIGSDS